MRPVFKLFLVWLIVGPGSGVLLDRPLFGQSAVATTQQPAVEPLRTAVDRPFDIRDIRLDLRVDLAKKTVDGEATVQVQSLRPIKSIDLDAVAFAVKKVNLATGTKAPASVRFSHDGKRLVIYLEPAWPTGQDGTLRIHYRVQEPKAGLHFFAPTSTEPDTPLSVWSQGEAVTNRYWFPCVDHPDQRQTTEVVVTVPAGFEALSNGKLVEHREDTAARTVTFDWKQDKPHPAYLVTMVVGQFDVVRDEWDHIPLLYYVPKGHQGEVPTTFGHTRDMLSYFSHRFGIRYPWDKYAQVIAYRFGGGMENTSATTMGDILKDERSLLDGTSDAIIAHELAHQWWGDMVTCRDWAHVWLNEGFASYAEALWDEHSQGTDAYAYTMFRKAEGAINGGKNRPVVDRYYANPMLMFDGRTYPKGAWLLHMLRRRLGDDAFFKAWQRYGTEYRLKSVETVDFRRMLERESGHNLERFFFDWTERPGSPVVEVATDYMASSQQARMVVKQTQSGDAFHFPLTLVFDCVGATKATTIEHEVAGKEYTFLVPLPGVLTRVDVDPDQRVLAEIKETKARNLWVAQLLQATSVPARLRAVRHFRDSKAEEDRELLARAMATDKFWAVQVEIAGVLGIWGDHASRAVLLQGSHHADPRVRRACIDSLGRLKPDPAVAIALKEMVVRGDPSYAVTGAAMTAYARQGAKDKVALLTPWVSRPSHHDIFRVSALSALGATRDLAALEPLQTWAQPGHPVNTRTAALRGMIELVKQAKPSDQQRQQVLKTLSAVLQLDDNPTRTTVISALPELGRSASSTLPVLDNISKKDTNERIRELAKRVAEQIRKAPGG